MKELKTIVEKKIAVAEKISLEALERSVLMVGQHNDDFIKDIITASFKTTLKHEILREKESEIEIPKPSFLDWLLRRKRKYKVQVSKNVYLSDDNGKLAWYTCQIKN